MSVDDDTEEQLIVVYACNHDDPAGVWIGGPGEGIEDFAEDVPEHADEVIWAAKFNGHIRELGVSAGEVWER